MADSDRTNRLGKGEEALFVELFENGLTGGPFLFGRYLRAKGLVSDEDIFNARMLQKNQNPRIGEIAVERGLMDNELVERLLVVQEETGLRFGDLAVQLGYISQQQLDEVLDHMEKSYLYFGEALVRIGVIGTDMMTQNLVTFQRLKVRIQSLDA